MPSPALPAEASSGLLSLAAEYHSLTARLPVILHARDAAAAELARLEELAHDMEDQAGHILDAIEAARPATPAEARAKLGVARALMAEGLDPGRDRFHAMAEVDAQRLIAGRPVGR